MRRHTPPIVNAGSTHILRPKHYRDRDIDPQFAKQSKKNAEGAALLVTRRAELESYREENPSKRNNASALARHFAPLWEMNERTLRRKIGKLI